VRLIGTELRGGLGDMSALSNALGEIDAAARTTADLSRPLVRALPVTGAAVSTFGELLPMQTVSASDSRARRIDEIQFDLHEGPCWDALASGEPVLEPDIRHRPSRVWPAFSPAIAELPIGALLAYPLVFGPLKLGAVDLYTDEPVSWAGHTAADARVMASAIARTVLRRALRDAESEADEGPYSRRLIHQATGMVIAQLRISAVDAELLIRGQAFATDQPMREIAQRILDRDLLFRRGESGIEAIG
jgi:hypothetical protein